MADQVTVTGEDLEALAVKLEAMGDQFDAGDLAAIHALFGLAGDALAERERGEVEGFLLPAVRNAQPAFGLSLPNPQVNTQGVLIGLLRNGASSMQDFHFKGGAAMGDGSV